MKDNTVSIVRQASSAAMNSNSFGQAARSHAQRGYSGGRRGGRQGNYSRRSLEPSFKDYFHSIEVLGVPTSTSFTVAVQGCSHGELDSIYESLEHNRENSAKNDPHNPTHIDILLCCGDVQTLRNTDDYHAFAVPQKYKAMGDFHAYYSGQKVAPILTIMIGGNHESSNYLQELYYGGWVAPNIYYLGAAGVINVCKMSSDGTYISCIRIAGVSGIYNSKHYYLGRYEMPPYSRQDVRSVYHTRRIEVERLRTLATCKVELSDANSSNDCGDVPLPSVDIMLSHDWPRGIVYHGDLPQLLKRKPFFKSEVKSNTLGSPANEFLLHTLRPRFWFAAHLHVRFEAVVRHEEKYEKESTSFFGLESEDTCPSHQTNFESLTDQMTRFLSLDKCLPKRKHLQILHIEPMRSRAVASGDKAAEFSHTNTVWLEYDAIWLAIHRRTERWTQRTQTVVDICDTLVHQPISNEEIQDVLERLKLAVNERTDSNCSSNITAIPLNFSQTVDVHHHSTPNRKSRPLPMVGNPQTDVFLNTLGLTHQITVPFDMSRNNYHSLPPSISNTGNNANDNNEIDIEDAEEIEDKVSENDLVVTEPEIIEDVIKFTNYKSTDPDEIELNDLITEDDKEAGDVICYTPESKKPRVDP